MEKSRFKFKGWDWTELADYFNIEMPKEIRNTCEEGKPLVDFIHEHTNCGVVDDEVEQACRAYLDALIKAEVEAADPDSPDAASSVYLWEGLSKISHNETFFRFFIPLLPYMWT